MGSDRSRRSLSPEQQPLDLKTEFHPRSHRPFIFQQQELSVLRDIAELVADSQQWRPFFEEGDHTFAEIALRASLNASQINSLLILISRVSRGEAKVTLRNENDIQRAWDNVAAMQVTPVSSLYSW